MLRSTTSPLQRVLRIVKTSAGDSSGKINRILVKTDKRNTSFVIILFTSHAHYIWNVKLLLFTIMFLLSLKGIGQNKIDADKIDSMAKVLDIRVEQTKGIVRTYTGMLDDGNGSTEECLFIDTVNKKLLKVISVQIVQIKFEDEKENSEAALKGMHFPKDTIRTAYYFHNDSLIKVDRRSAVLDFEFYFHETHCFQRMAHGKALLIANSNVYNKHLLNAGNYLKNFKSLIPYATSDVRTGDEFRKL